MVHRSVISALWEAEAESLQIQGYPGLLGEFKVNVGSDRERLWRGAEGEEREGKTTDQHLS